MYLVDNDHHIKAPAPVRKFVLAEHPVLVLHRPALHGAGASFSELEGEALTAHKVVPLLLVLLLSKNGDGKRC